MGIRASFRKRIMLNRFKRKSNINSGATVDVQKNQILWIIDNEGSYLLPKGYEKRDYNTAHFEAFKALIDEKIIEEKGAEGRSVKWGRVRIK